MRAMFKKEVADRAGVTVKTLMNWCKPYRQELRALGLTATAKKLPPQVVAFMAEKFCIDL